MTKNRQYLVTLTEEERQMLLDLLHRGKTAGRLFTRAHILLLADESDASDGEIARVLRLNRVTVSRTRLRFVQGGVDRALHDRPRSGAPRRLDDDTEQLVIALARDAPPPGHPVWTMQLLANTLVELVIVPTISDETVRRTLKKNDSQPWRIQKWVIPPESASFVAAMEEILDLYDEPADPRRPRVCVDEMPYQLLADKMAPLPGEPGHPTRQDYSYTPGPMCNIFGAFQFETGWRHFTVTDRRTTQDFAALLRDLVDIYFPTATVIRLITDNLNTHGPHALYATYPPEEAHRIARKLEWHFTPVHGSWLNMVEIELGLLKSHGLKQRLATVARVAEETAAREAERNAAHATVNWRFTTPQARQTLRRLYPNILDT